MQFPLSRRKKFCAILVKTVQTPKYITYPEEVPEEAKKRIHRKIWSLYVGTATFCVRVLKSTMKRLKIN